MSKYKLNYSGLNSKEDFEKVSFTSARKRSEFIADRVIGGPKKVYVLVVGYSEDRSDVYVFKDWWCIDLVVKQSWDTFWLIEYESYEEAYKYALDVKEESELCYS
jgi:hypothetical protein